MKNLFKNLIKIILLLLVLCLIFIVYFVFNIKEIESGNYVSDDQKNFTYQLQNFTRHKEKPLEDFLHKNYDIFCFVDSYDQPSKVLNDFVKIKNIKFSDDIYLTENFWAMVFYSSHNNSAIIYDINRNNFNSYNNKSWCGKLEHVFIKQINNKIEFLKKN